MPGLLGSMMYGLFVTQVNDPLVKLTWLSSLYYNFMFFICRDPVELRFQENYAKFIQNFSEKGTTGSTSPHIYTLRPEFIYKKTTCRGVFCFKFGRPSST